MTTSAVQIPVVTDSSATDVLTRYEHGVLAALSDLAQRTGPSGPPTWFEPGWAIPTRSRARDDFWSVATLSHGPMGAHHGRELHLLDLTANPRVRTTKTFGTALIVARAVAHTEATGEPVLLLTPSAANKAVALREAVQRAYESRFATPATLRVAVVVPASSLPKLWDSTLGRDPGWAAANPLGVYSGAERETVKQLTTRAVERAADEVLRRTGFRIWYTLDPRNYMGADVVRAFYEAEFLATGDRPGWHAHAVSSGYGLLGHDFGTRILHERGHDGPTPGYLFVQHLETPDLITDIRYGPTQHRVPGYRVDAADGLFHADGADPHFPATCTDPAERLERTFYTRQPPTTPLVQDLADRRPADGLVVSLPECLARYGEARARLAAGGLTRLPSDPRDLREYASVMATVGALRAIEQDLVPDGVRVVVHASGAYSVGEFVPPPEAALVPVEDVDDVMALLAAAAEAPATPGS